MTTSTGTRNGSEGTQAGNRLRVLIAGGGIAALEAVLSLRELVGRRPEVELVAPNAELAYRALATEEPFGVGEPRRIPLGPIADDLGFVQHLSRVQRIDPSRSTVLTAEGDELGYDALLIAIGGTTEAAVPGALTYSGPESNAELRGLLDALRAGEVRRVIFAVPPAARWPVPLYELTLLTARYARGERIDAELVLATHEAGPLELFGPRASEGVRQLLAIEGIELRTSAAPSDAREDALHLASGEWLAADAVVALPRHAAPPIPGLPQGPQGFVDTDAFMRVRGLERVWAAGDISWFPIKQGGLATQQADVAATAIAQLVDPTIETRPFAPVLRGALLTGRTPQYLRAPVGRTAQGSAAAAAPLWWPPSKIAGRLLAPYLGGRAGVDLPQPPLEDLGSPEDEDWAERERDHAETLELALTSADLDARAGDYDGALRWLDVAERLNLTLPPAYAVKRERWTAERRIPRVA